MLSDHEGGGNMIEIITCILLLLAVIVVILNKGKLQLKIRFKDFIAEMVLDEPEKEKKTFKRTNLSKA